MPAHEIPTAARAPRYELPPEERFWKRHSPNHEFPLSGVLALALFAVFMGILVLSIKMEWFTAQAPVETAAIAFGDGNDPATSNHPVGTNGANGNGKPVARPEAGGNAHDPGVKPGPVLPDVPRPAVRPSEPLPEAPPLNPANLPAISFNAIGEEATAKLGGSLDPPGPPNGTGPSGPPGPTGPGPTQRIGRVYRWHITLDTRTGAEYLKQLRFLKAFVGIPEKKAGAALQYRIIRDLTRLPARGQIEEPAQVNRFFAVDAKPESVEALASALGLARTPDHLVAFFPRELEEELARKELAYRGRPESQIAATQFRILWRGHDWEVQVTDQRMK